MGDYSNYFGTSTTYSSPYANTYANMAGAETTYTAYPTAAASVSTATAAAYAAATVGTTPGTTYTSYTINPAATNTAANTTANTTYNYVDWASAATAAAISSATTANRPETKPQQNIHHKGNNKQNNWYNRNKSSGSASGKEPPKTFYCDICKVSCMGAQTYKEHQNGQKHKKKEKEKEGDAKPTPRGYHSFGKLYRCELCDISCTGEQAFSAHMTGSKHNKTVLLFRKLGKPVPNPTVTNKQGEKEEVSLEQVKEELAKKAERIAKEEAERTEKRNKRNQQAEERAKKRLDEIENRRKMMDERRSKWEEERWKREEEWRVMQEQREEEWKEWQETEQCETTPQQVQASAGFASRKGDNNDNRLIMKLHEEIYPEQAELADIKKLVKVAEDNLKTISDKMREETENELKDKGLLKDVTEGEDAVETRVLKGCVRIGDLANGLLLRGDKCLEMMVFCTDKPTVYLLQNIKEKFEELLTESQKKVLTVTIDGSRASFVVTDPKGYNVTVTLTSKAMEAEATAASITADVAAKVLDVKTCLRGLDETKHSKWFQTNVSPVPSAVIALRILSHLSRKEEMKHWKSAVKPWVFHVIVGQLLAANTGRKFSPGDIIRRTLEALSGGVLYSSNGAIHDPCCEPTVDLTTDLPKEDVEKVTADAQTALRCLVFGKLHEFLGVPPYTDPVLEPEPSLDAQEFEGYDGAQGHMMHGGPPVRMRGMRGPRRPHPPGGRFGPMGNHGGPYGEGPMGPYDGPMGPYDGPMGPYDGPMGHYDGPYGDRPYGGQHHHPYGHGPYGHGPRPYPTHLGPMGHGGPWRGPSSHMRRGGPHSFGPRGFGGPRIRGPRPNKNRKRKPEDEDTKVDVKKECVEKEAEKDAENVVQPEPETMEAAAE